jgi:hypothetical protein
MKLISIVKAHEILSNAKIVVVDGKIAYPTLATLTGQPENEFLYLSYKVNGESYSTKFQEGENVQIKISGSSIFLIDFEGDQMDIVILQTQNLEN